MKQALFFLLVFTSFICGYAQKMPGDTLSKIDFSARQKTAWDSIETIWYKKQFAPFLKKNKIKISCATCDGVYLDFVLQIHDDGHCHPKLVKNRKCEAHLTRTEIAEMEKFFMLLNFPACFYNAVLEVRLGRYLKC
jgi:hypothetical protein